MSSYTPYQWTNRNSEHPYRRTLTNVNDTTDVKTVDVTRAEGRIDAQGDSFDANTMNAMEGRIASAFSTVDQAMGNLNNLTTQDKSSLVGAINEVAAGGGGGGSSTLAGLTDTSISSPTNGQVLKYNSTSSKWENAAESGGGSNHKLTIKVNYDSTNLDNITTAELSYDETVDETGTAVSESNIISLLESGYECEIRFTSVYPPNPSQFNTYIFDMASYEVENLVPTSYLGHINFVGLNRTTAEFDIRISIHANGTVTCFVATNDYETALASKADLASPAFTGNPTAPTQTAGDDSTKIATTAFIQDAIEKATEFQTGETFTFTNGVYAGNLAGSSKDIYIFVPTPKKTTNVNTSTMTMTGSWYIRGVGVNVVSNQALSSVGTVSFQKADYGIQIKCTLTTASSATNNSVLGALAYSNCKFTFN